MGNIKTFVFLYQDFEKQEIGVLDFLVFTTLSSCMAHDFHKHLKQIKYLQSRWKKISQNKEIANALAYDSRRII